MSRFVVTMIVDGNCYRREEVARDEADAAYKAQGRVPFSEDCRVVGVKCIGRCA